MDSESFSVSVTEINDPPVLADLPAQIAGEGLALTFTAAASDTDLPVHNSDLLAGPGVYRSRHVYQPFDWCLQLDPDRVAGPGSYIATVAVDDGGYPAIADPKSDLQEVTISVTEVNRPPVLAAIGNRSGRRAGYDRFSRRRQATLTHLPTRSPSRWPMVPAGRCLLVRRSHMAARSRLDADRAQARILQF